MGLAFVYCLLNPSSNVNTTTLLFLLLLIVLLPLSTKDDLLLLLLLLLSIMLLNPIDGDQIGITKNVIRINRIKTLLSFNPAIDLIIAALAAAFLYIVMENAVTQCQESI